MPRPKKAKETKEVKKPKNNDKKRDRLLYRLNSKIQKILKVATDLESLLK